MLTRLWRDEFGGVNSAELVLIVTLLAIGIIVGMKSLRDSTVTEFADLAQAIANLDQSYTVSGITVTLPSGSVLSTAPSEFTDAPDFCDTTTDEDTGTSGSKCVNVCVLVTATGELAP